MLSTSSNEQVKSEVTGAVSSRGRRDWNRWAEECVRAAGQNPEKTLAIAEPDLDTAAKIDSAREHGVECIICGFLPDEIDWPEWASNETIEYFIECFEFAPLQLGLETPPEPTDDFTPRIIAIADNGSGAIESLACGCADGVGGKAICISLERENAEQIVANLVSASLLINASSDWTLGFAVDELAARIGLPVLRLFNPGYSPIRYAPLAIELPMETASESLRLRPAFSSFDWGVSLTERVPRPVFSWNSSSAVARWRKLFGSEAYAEFWLGMDLESLRHAQARETARWMNRSAAWAALTATIVCDDFSPEARSFLETTVARWMVGDQEVMPGGTMRDAAIGRWVRVCPEWISKYRRAADNRRGVNESIANWALQGSVWPCERTSVAEMTKIALVGMGGESMPETELALVAAWGNSWSDVLQPTSGVRSLEPAWRPACVELCWSHLNSLAVGRADADALDAALIRPELWRDAMGSSGVVLRFLALLRRGLRGLAMEAWRSVIGMNFPGLSRGWSRLAHVAFADERMLVAWLQELSSIDAGASGPIAGKLLNFWFVARVRDLWRERWPAMLNAELAFARRLLARYCELSPEDNSAIHLAGRMAAFDGDDGATEAAIAEYAAVNGGDGGELPAVIAFIQVVKGRRSAATRSLSKVLTPTGGAFACFMRSVAALWLDDEIEALRCLRMTLEIDVRFFERAGVGDARWILIACALRRVNLMHEAGEFLRKAEQEGNTSLQFVDLYGRLEPRNSNHTQEWMRIVNTIRNGACLC